MRNFNLTMYFISLFSGAIGSWCIARFGHKLFLIDIPTKRSSHHIKIPKGGGVGILAVFTFCAINLSFSKSLWIPAAFLSLVSFLGDINEISVRLRLVIQSVCSVIFLICMFQQRHVCPEAYLWILPLVIFIVGTTNFYNFMDGIDGIAGIGGVIGFSFLALYAYLFNKAYLSITFNICIALSCIGFLFFNFPKAKVFMGDVGSILLGFVFAVKVLSLSNSFIDVVCLSSFIFPFYADVLTTMVVRLKNGEKLSEPHRKHLFQLFANEYGFSHWKVSVGLGRIQLFIGSTILLIKDKGIISVLSLLLLYFILFSYVSCYVRQKLKVNHAI